MADRCLFITWSRANPGQEERALEVFNEAIGIAGRFQQEGRIEDFDVALMRPNASVGGYMSIRGSAQQINDLVESEEFRRNTMAAFIAVEDIKHLHGYVGDGVAQQIGLFQQELAKA